MRSSKVNNKNSAFKKIKELPIELIDGDRSSRYPKRDEFQEEGIPFLNTTNIVNNRLDFSNANFISREKFNQLRKGKLKPFDIVMTTRGSIGKIAIFTSSEYSTGFINAQMLIIRADHNLYSPIFLYYVLQSSSVQSEIHNYSSGSAQPQIPIKDFREVEIYNPPLPTQRKIASILSAYDDLIENNTRRIQILEEMAQAIYREWFVHFRFPGHEGVKMVDSGTELGMIPEGWEVHLIGDVIETLGGGTPSIKKLEYWGDGDINWFTPSDLTSSNTMFIKDSGRKINKLGLEKSSARMFPANSVMMTSRATIGVTAINSSPACTNQGFITCIPNERLKTYHLYYWILENKDKIINVASGATYKEINRTVFRSFFIAIPPNSLEANFQETITPIGKLIENLISKKENLQVTRDLLLPKLISGDLDVSDIEIARP